MYDRVQYNHVIYGHVQYESVLNDRVHYRVQYNCDYVLYDRV